MQFSPVANWSLMAGYFPVRIVNDPLRRRSIIRQDLKSATSSFNLPLGKKSLRQTVSVQNFSVFGDISPQQNQWMVNGHHHLQLFKGLGVQHSFSENWGVDTASSFSSQAFGVVVSGPGTLTTQAHYILLSQPIGNTQRIGGKMSYRPKEWIIDFQIDRAIGQPVTEDPIPALFCGITITRMLTYARKENEPDRD